MGYDNMVVTKQVYFSSAFLKLSIHISGNVAGIAGGPQYYQRRYRRRESSPLSNNYFDDTFTLKDLLNLEKKESLI